MNDLQVQPQLPVDPAELARVLWRRKGLLLAPWLTALLIGIAAAVLLKPVYISSTTLMLDRGQNMQGLLGNMGGGPDAQLQGDVMREQVQSSLFLRSVIGATGLKEDRPTRAWALKSASKYPGLSQDEQIEAFLVDNLRQAVDIRPSKGQLFQVGVSDFDPDRAKKFCESVANEFVLSSKARQLEAVQAQQEFSAEQLQVYKRALEEAEGRLEAARRSIISTTITGSLVNPNNFAFASALLEQATVDADEQRSRLGELKSQFPGKLRDNDPQMLSGDSVSAMSAQLTSLQNLLGRAMLTEGTANGGVSLHLQIARKNTQLEAMLAGAAARALPAASAEARELAVRYRLGQCDIAARESWRSWLAAQVGIYQRQMVMAPESELDLSRLKADVDQQRGLYDAFQQQSAAAQIAEAFQNAKVSGRFVIMEPPTRPLLPAKPNRPLLVVLAFVIGGIVGVGTVLLVEHNDQSLKSADEVEKLLKLPVLGAVPRVPELERPRSRGRSPVAAASPGALPAPKDLGLIQRLKVESPLGLEFKRIYLNLAMTRGRKLPRTILITSSARGDGKTTTSACLGITLAREHRQRTLLVDFDLRSPALHRALGMPGSSWR